MALRMGSKWVTDRLQKKQCVGGAERILEEYTGENNDYKETNQKDTCPHCTTPQNQQLQLWKGWGGFLNK